MMTRYNNLGQAINQAAKHLLTQGEAVSNKRWQGKDSTSSEFSTFEVTDLTFSAPIEPKLEDLQNMIRPNLPWADNHFLERVGGEPINPGNEYKNWPYYKSDEFRTEGEQFTHTYMERFWTPPRPGLRYPFGNLTDVINLLVRDPLTRQAFFPVWFPEDTGATHGGRIPCSLGYHFLCRKNKLHIFYPIRSCDLLRHFQDDVYLACRLLLWVLEKLQSLDPTSWEQISPGDLTMNIYSLHIFNTEVNLLRSKLEMGLL